MKARVTVVLAHITDIHLGHRFAQKFGVDIQRNFITVLEDIKRRGITEVVCTGDIAEDEMASWFFDTIKEYGFLTHIVLGNHDNPVIMELSNEQGIANHYYRIPCDQAVLLFCDTRQAYMDEEQLSWLTEEISSSDLPILLFLHHPVLDYDNSFMDQKYALKNRDAVKSALCATNKEIHLFCGHYHATDERSFANIHQHITPSIFYQIKKYSEKLERDEKPFGYRIIQMERTIQTEVINFF